MKAKLPTQEDIERLERDERERRRPAASGRFERRRSDRAMRPKQVSRRAGEQGGFLIRPLLVLLLVLALVLGAQAQMTVTGRVVNSTGAVQPGTNVTFYPLSTPLVVSASDVVTSSQVATNADGAGNFSVQLLRGDYRVVYGNWSRDAFIISVTNTTGTAEIGTLVKSRLTYVAKWIPRTNAWATATILLASDPDTDFLTDESDNFLAAD